MKAFLLGVEQNTKGDKVTITHASENSQSKSVFDVNIFPKKFFEYLYTLTGEFKKLCVFGNGSNYALTGLKIRDVDEGARQEVQFIVNIKQGSTYFENAKTAWREMRDIPLEVFKGEESEGRRQAEAMNCIIAVFNSFQEYVGDHIAQWLEMDDSGGQLSIFARKEIEDTKELMDTTFERIDKLENARSEFHTKMKALSNETGGTVTISSGGKELAVFAPDKAIEVIEE